MSFIKTSLIISIVIKIWICATGGFHESKFYTTQLGPQPEEALPDIKID